MIHGHGNVPTTTSIQVADHFGKQHKNVMQSIKSIIETLKNTVTAIERNFTLKDRMVSVGYGQKKTPVYEMNRDGFMLLVMGFTGEKALVFKNDFIVAFNEMKAALEKTLDAFPSLKKLHFCNLSLSVYRGLENNLMMFIVSIHDQ